MNCGGGEEKQLKVCTHLAATINISQYAWTRRWLCVQVLSGYLRNRAEITVDNLQWPIAQHDLSHGHTTVKMEMARLSLAARV